MARYIDADAIMPKVVKDKKFILRKEDFDECGELVFRTCYAELEDFIRTIPTADVVEVKRGYWIPVPSSDMSTGKAYKCSECDKMRYGCRLPPYCQECGAKMDGERKCEDK